MKSPFYKISEIFPIRSMVRIAVYSAIAFTVIIFLMNLMEHRDVKSAIINQFINFIMIMAMNFLSLFFIYQLYRRNMRGNGLAVYAFFLTALFGSALIILTDLLVIHLIKNNLMVVDKKFDQHGVGFFLYALLQSALITYFVVTWQIFVLSQNERMRIGIENAALKAANSEAVNQLLLQQIHPHFLFNALTTIKSLISKQPEVASSYLVKLSNFLRASMSSVTVSTASLTKELNFCSDYLELQKVRLGDALFYTIDINAEIKENSYLPVFALQQLAENAIKHNSFSEDEPLHVEITEADGIITVKNDYRPNYDKENSLGSGLSNLNERYERLTGEKIVIQTGQSYFYVSFKLITSENNNNRR
jgi:two-component system LytT family sensor kinase